MTRKKGYMEERVFREVVDECAQHATPVRLIRWGEPFLHPKIMDFISYVKREKTIPLHITTNGLHIDETQLKQLVDMKLDSIVFSFQGATRQKYEAMRNNKRYDELNDTIMRLVAIRGDKRFPYIHVSTTVTNESEEEIDNFVHTWGSIVDFVSVGKTNLSKIKIFKGSHDAQEIDKLLAEETIEKVYSPCKEIYQKLSVNYDGSVSACCTDFDNYMVVGNLKSETLEKIWNGSERLKGFRILVDQMCHSSLTLCRACYQTTRV
jgi:MoaA/NifB/PqqE/SkfB family radical SAM enzyme